MRLKIQMLDRDTEIDNVVPVTSVEAIQGETLNLYFQLVDADTGERYIPAWGAVVQCQLPRLIFRTPTINGACQPNDYTINRQAQMAFPYVASSSYGDASIWYIPLVQADTVNMTTSNLIVTLTEGASITMGVARNAVRMRGAQQV